MLQKNAGIFKKVGLINFTKTKYFKIMTNELKSLFDQFSNLISRWNAEEISNEKELLAETIQLTAKLKVELRKPQPEQTSIPEA